jgi:hypothetical protein
MRFWSKLIAGVAASAGLTAQAVDLPAATLLGEVLIPKFAEKVDTVQFGTISLTNPIIGTASFSSAGTPFPLLTADAQAGPNPSVDRLFTRGVGTLNYSMMITSTLPANTPLSVDVFVAGGVSGTASAGASFVLESSWLLFDLTSGLQVGGEAIQTPVPLTGSFAQGFAHTLPLELRVDHLYRITLRVDAEAAATEPGSSAVAHAFIDPFFSFGAGVDPALSAFNFSTGIGNAAPVPEPAPWALLAGGLLLLALRRSQAGAAATASSSSLSMRS